MHDPSLWRLVGFHHFAVLDKEPGISVNGQRQTKKGQSFSGHALQGGQCNCDECLKTEDRREFRSTSQVETRDLRNASITGCADGKTMFGG